MTSKADIRLLYQPTSSSFLGGFIAEWYAANSFSITHIDCRASVWSRAWPAIKAFHPDRNTWYRRRWEAGVFSPSAWDRNTRVNGRLLDRLGKSNSKILQISKEYFPHPRYRDMEYYVFINYNARLSMRDGFTPWRPKPDEEAAFIEKEDLLFRHATHVFTAGEYLRRNLIDEAGVSPTRVTTVANGVNPYYLRHPPPAFSGEFTNKLLFVGWDFGLKGGRDILLALPHIRAQFPRVELVVIGPDEAQKIKLGALVDTPGVRWMGSQKVKIEDYRSADLFVLPSLRDSYGFVFLEAMSQGLPCIGADINGMPEMIDHGHTGYIVPRNSPAHIADAVCRYYADSSNKQRMAELSYKRVLEKFTWDVVLSKVNRIMNV